MISEDQVDSLLAQSDLMVFPIIEENYSNLLLTAVFKKLPVIAFNIGGNDDLVHDQHTGKLINSIDFESLGNEILYFLCERPLYRQLDFGKITDDLKPEILVNKMDDLYEAVG